ncbi:selenocysteine lyase/cysteine desulfurase [Actinopolyspora biskrensis]|uniref:Selenocysteine lyase/cysteine desulfurase n=1 Tax=Actinopolyspora biskrensis TaxID=1470178 RepID=A0A852YW70_9ACTN|nr:aminotransferase class V-fold PLP-dependent enzyme [Actinopolyspora biskrensis]NYH77972.1 selenocysteine lyase/cysteine desulfurase [Actinopolyspora biskrensis]
MREAFGASFGVDPGYLNTAGIGVPPDFVADSLHEVITRWSEGRIAATEFDEPVARAKEGFADLVGVPSDRVSAGSSVSQLVGTVAAGVPAGSSVLVVEREFTSVTFPFAVQRDRGVRVTEVPPNRLLEAVPEHDVVAVSLVQSADGRVFRPEELRAAAEQHGVRVLLDVSQAAGWMPLELEWAEWIVGCGYKWLMTPRGAAWLATRPEVLDLPRAHGANWYAGQDPRNNLYGLPLRLADGAGAFDASPDWFAQVGAAAALGWLTTVDLASVREHCLELAGALCAELEAPPPESPIVSLDAADAVAELRAAGVRCTARDGRLRLAFHLYNTEADVRLVSDALRRNPSAPLR